MNQFISFSNKGYFGDSRLSFLHYPGKALPLSRLYLPQKPPSCGDAHLVPQDRPHALHWGVGTPSLYLARHPPGGDPERAHGGPSGLRCARPAGRGGLSEGTRHTPGGGRACGSVWPREKPWPGVRWAPESPGVGGQCAPFHLPQESPTSFSGKHQAVGKPRCGCEAPWYR